MVTAILILNAVFFAVLELIVLCLVKMDKPGAFVAAILWVMICLNIAGLLR